MGRYLNPEMETLMSKADRLIELGAEEIDAPPAQFEDIPEGKALVCVVQNTHFDAAAYVSSFIELAAFTLASDYRPKRWLLMDKEYVKKNAL